MGSSPTKDSQGKAVKTSSFPPVDVFSWIVKGLQEKLAFFINTVKNIYRIIYDFLANLTEILICDILFVDNFYNKICFKNS